jgi:hypothetical protein
LGRLQNSIEKERQNNGAGEIEENQRVIINRNKKERGSLARSRSDR